MDAPQIGHVYHTADGKMHALVVSVEGDSVMILYKRDRMPVRDAFCTMETFNKMEFSR